MRHRVALVGAGMIAHHHAEKWREAGADVVAIADVEPRVLAAFAKKHGIAAAYTDYAELLWREATVEIVDVCAPPWLHAPMTIAALESGKHVLCEKPMALNAAEAESMAGAAEAAGKVLACRQGDTRLARETRTLREVVHSGVLGEIYFMRLIARSLSRPGIEYNPEARWFLDRTKAGGGVLYDWGVYDLEILFSVFGALQVETITATTFGSVERPKGDIPFDVEEHAVATLTLRDGPMIFWERGWATHLPPENRWDLYGTRAGFSFSPHSAVLKTEMNPRLTRYGHAGPISLEMPPLAPPGLDVFEDFLLAVEGVRAPACSGQEAATMLRIIDDIYAAATHISV
jgi:predicted dehydrogenase